MLARRRPIFSWNLLIDSCPHRTGCMPKVARKAQVCQEFTDVKFKSKHKQQGHRRHSWWDNCDSQLKQLSHPPLLMQDVYKATKTTLRKRRCAKATCKHYESMNFFVRVPLLLHNCGVAYGTDCYHIIFGRCFSAPVCPWSLHVDMGDMGDGYDVLI